MGALIAAMKAGVAAMTATNWGTTGPGASPQTSPARAITVPAGNPGLLTIYITGTGAANVTASIAGGSFNAISDGSGLSVTNGQTLAFRLTGASRTVSIQVADNAAGVNVGDATITCS